MGFQTRCLSAGGLCQFGEQWWVWNLHRVTWVSISLQGVGEWEGLALNFCLQSSPLLCTSLPAVVGCRQLDGGYWGNLRPHLNAFGPGVQTKLLSRK